MGRSRASVAEAQPVAAPVGQPDALVNRLHRHIDVVPDSPVAERVSFHHHIAGARVTIARLAYTSDIYEILVSGEFTWGGTFEGSDTMHVIGS